MTNCEKFKTAKEREIAFGEWCKTQQHDCPRGSKCLRCMFEWLDLEAEDNNPIQLPCPFCGCTDIVMQDVGGFELACLGCGFHTPAYMDAEKLISEYQRVARAVMAEKESEAK